MRMPPRVRAILVRIYMPARTYIHFHMRGSPCTVCAPAWFGILAARVVHSQPIQPPKVVYRARTIMRETDCRRHLIYRRALRLYLQPATHTSEASPYDLQYGSCPSASIPVGCNPKRVGDADADGVGTMPASGISLL